MTLELSLWDKAPYIFFDGDLPDHVREAIDDELSYEVEDYEYTDAWKQGEWDGKEYLLSQSKKGNWFFPVGLLDRVRKVLDTYGLDYEVEGISRPGRGDFGLEWHFDGELRDYQETAVDKALRYGSGIIVMPTGSGKTLTGLAIAKEIDRKFIVTVDNAEIADQWAERIEERLGVEPACYYGGTRETGDVMVALYQSAYMDGEVVPEFETAVAGHDVWLPDEVHNVGADTFNRVAMSIPADYRYGFSATPERSDNAELKVFGGVGPIIVDLSVETMIEEGYLAEPEWVTPDAPSNKGGGYYQNWQDEYKEEIVKNERRNRLIATTVDDLEKPALVTVERIAHGERLEALIEGSRFVHGSSSDRPEIIQSFRDGELPTMIATRGIVGEGFDVEGIRSLVVGGGFKSETSMIQQVGRALRPGESGKATIVDFWDRGQFISGWSEERMKTYEDYYGVYGPL